MSFNKTKNRFEVSVRFETRNIGGCYYGYFREEKLDYFHTMICDKFIENFTRLCSNKGINIVKSEKFLEDNKDLGFADSRGDIPIANNLSLHRYWFVGFFIFHLEDMVLVDTEKVDYLLQEATNKYRVGFDTGEFRTGIKDITRFINTYEVFSTIKKVDYFLEKPKSFHSIEDRVRIGSLKAIKDELGKYTKSDNNFIKSVNIDTLFRKFKNGTGWGKSYTIELRSENICFSSKYHMILEKAGVPPVYCDSGFLIFFLKYCYNKESNLKDSDLDFFSERYGVNVWKSAKQLSNFISKHYKDILNSLLAYYLQVKNFTIQVTYTMVDPDSVDISVNMLENFGKY